MHCSIVFSSYIHRCINGPLKSILPSLDRKCSPEGCWYCSDLCHHCMQPSNTLYSGTLQEKLLKFCSEECKGLWFPSPEQKTLHVASCLDEISQSEDKAAPLMTLISQKEKRVEQIYLSVGRISAEGVEDVEKPFIVWHMRELEHQYFAHFYISEDCLPLNSVWIKQICTSESEAIFKNLATRRTELQEYFLELFNEAAKLYDFESLRAFLMQKSSFLQNGKSIIKIIIIIAHNFE